jgi:hypothetical protein
MSASPKTTQKLTRNIISTQILQLGNPDDTCDTGAATSAKKPSQINTYKIPMLNKKQMTTLCVLDIFKAHIVGIGKKQSNRSVPMLNPAAT